MFTLYPCELYRAQLRLRTAAEKPDQSHRPIHDPGKHLLQ